MNPSVLILPLDSQDATLGNVGGKGANLAKLTRVGAAEGLVRVILDPHSAQLLPGEIMVCPGTDPAWTPLFLAAAGLVMELDG